MTYAVSRLVPDIPLPPYAYVPSGQHPHPTRHPAGHRFGLPRQDYSAPDPEHWDASRPYLYGIDLFNYGYYWEAHEVWEGLWHACGREGVTADLFKALIALAAAGVKLREGRTRGVRYHAARARVLFDRITKELGPRRTHYLGLELVALCDIAATLRNRRVPGTGSLILELHRIRFG